MAFLEYRPTKTLYHYTSPAGFSGILASKSLWFSDLTTANDPREVHLGFDKFMSALNSVILKEYPGKKGHFLISLADRLRKYRENTRAYCCCFSLAVDTLPMWGAYGSNYTGLAIGFRATSVVDMPARVQKAKYLDENTGEDFKTLVLDLAMQIQATKYGSQVEEILAGASAFAAMTALKHETWSYECEVRVIHAQRILPPQDTEHKMFSMTSLLPDGEEWRWTKPLERQSGGQNIRYLAFPFGRYRNKLFEPAEAIERVILGPKCTLSVDQTTSMLQAHGFRRFQIARSNCQIR
jgi:Protein of unknown function (DUF2971)